MYDRIRRAKEEMCHVSLDFQEELNSRDDPLSIEQRSYELPGGDIIEINHHKRITATECIFQPTLVGESHPEL